MKLYTEEQVRKAIDFFISDKTKKDKVIETLTPIELPSDEEISKYIEKTFYGVKKHYFKAGVEFMRKLILNLNK